jgi:purine-binding chemotaxis protein CheW
MFPVGSLSERRFVVFHLAGADCALPAESVREILPMAALLHLPGQPPILEGFLNLRCRPVPVVSARRLFDLPPAEPGMFTPLIVIHGEESDLALLVDRVDDLATVPASGLQPLAANHSFNDCAEAQFTAAGRDVTVISSDRLLLAQERRCIADLQALAARRLEELEAARS